MNFLPQAALMLVTVTNSALAGPLSPGEAVEVLQTESKLPTVQGISQ